MAPEYTTEDYLNDLRISAGIVAKPVATGHTPQ